METASTISPAGLPPGSEALASAHQPPRPQLGDQLLPQHAPSLDEQATEEMNSDMRNTEAELLSKEGRFISDGSLGEIVRTMHCPGPRNGIGLCVIRAKHTRR